MRDEVRQPLRIEDGRFMRGDKEVPVENGNREQIALLQAATREAERIEIEKEALEGNLDVELYVEDIRYNIVCDFKCVCGQEIKEKERRYTDNWEDLDAPEWDGDCITCPNCGRIYQIEYVKAKLV